MFFKRNAKLLIIGAVVVAAVLLFSIVRANAAEDYSMMEQSVVLIETTDGMGSGVIIGPNAVLTSKHVVDGSGGATVNFNGMLFGLASTDIKMIEGADAAVLIVKVPPTLPVIKLNCTEAKLMDDITIVGFPLGIGPMFSKGQINASEMMDMGEDGMSYLTWAAINHGNSGGPVFNKNNELIAIAHATMIDKDREGAAIGALTAIAPLCSVLKKEIR